MMKNKLLVVLALLLLVTSLAACNSAPQEPFPRSMKGYELYSWPEDGQWRFTLITGTNRNKTLEEILSGESAVTEDGWVNLKASGVKEIKTVLNRVPAGEFVAWTSGSFAAEPEASKNVLAMPPQSIIDEVKAHAAKLGLQFRVN